LINDICGLISSLQLCFACLPDLIPGYAVQWEGAIHPKVGTWWNTSVGGLVPSGKTEGSLSVVVHEQANNGS